MPDDYSRSIELPHLRVTEPTKFALVIAPKTAKAPGLAEPLTLLAVADEAIK